jgi:flagellin
MLSVNNNYGAAIALQNLARTNTELSQVQNRISTGQKVSSAKDNGAVFAIAEGLRNRSNTIGRVKEGIGQVNAAVATGVAAASKIGDVLKDMKQLATDAASDTIDDDQRAALNATFVELRDAIARIVDGATVNGTNFVDGSEAAGVNAMVGDIGATAATFEVTSDNTSLGAIQLSRGLVLSDMVTDAGVTGAINDGSGVATDLDRVLIETVDGDYTVTIDAGMTVDDYVEAFNIATNGAVTASFDDASGTITYESALTFNLTLVDGSAGTPPTAAAAAALLGAGATVGTAVTAASVTSTAPTSTTISGFDFSVGAAGEALAGISATATLADRDTSQSLMAAIDTAIVNLNVDVATMTGQQKGLEIQNMFLTSLQDELDNTVSTLVDADLAKESARLQSLQVRQQLGAQALSIANQGPQVLLSFFQG